MSRFARLFRYSEITVLTIGNVLPGVGFRNSQTVAGRQGDSVMDDTQPCFATIKNTYPTIHTKEGYYVKLG